MIAGDHGAFEADHSKFKNGKKDFRPVEEIAQNLLNLLILFKDFSSKGDLKISDSPVSLENIMPTVFEKIGLKKNAGHSSFADRSSPKFDRRAHIVIESKALEFSVKGDASNIGSWKKTDKLIIKGGQSEIDSKQAQALAKEIEFYYNFER